MTDLDPTSTRAAYLDRLAKKAQRVGAIVMTDEAWEEVARTLTEARRARIEASVMLTTATQEASRMRELVLDMCDVAGGLSDDRPPIVRLSAIIGMAAEALNPDTLR